MNDFCLDYTQGSFWQRITKPDLRHEMLYKALGLKKNPHKTVLDATAGWGRDGLIIAALGCDVILCEQHPQVAHILHNALNHAHENDILKPIIERTQLVVESSLTVIPRTPADVIYCDPMFSDKGSALPKKELQVLRDLIQTPPESEQLIECAIEHSKERVVVKRAKQTKPYLKPTFTLTAKSHAFDVYITGSHHELVQA